MQFSHESVVLREEDTCKIKDFVHELLSSAIHVWI